MTAVELEHAVSPGVELRVLGKGMVPVYEEHTARMEADIRLDEWEAMEEFEKALYVAQRRIRLALDNIQAEAQIKEAKRNSRIKK